jgi:DNA-binding PadR family transcriptional regulator
MVEEKGYITSRLEDAPAGAGGLPRRIYATTPLGRRMFAAWTSGAKQLVPELGR